MLRVSYTKINKKNIIFMHFEIAVDVRTEMVY